jgi:hypothetical protein
MVVYSLGIVKGRRSGASKWVFQKPSAAIDGVLDIRSPGCSLYSNIMYIVLCSLVFLKMIRPDWAPVVLIIKSYNKMSESVALIRQNDDYGPQTFQ